MKNNQKMADSESKKMGLPVFLNANRRRDHRDVEMINDSCVAP
jgi:hypothetical protein